MASVAEASAFERSCSSFFCRRRRQLRCSVRTAICKRVSSSSCPPTAIVITACAASLRWLASSSSRRYIACSARA